MLYILINHHVTGLEALNDNHCKILKATENNLYYPIFIYIKHQTGILVLKCPSQPEAAVLLIGQLGKFPLVVVGFPYPRTHPSTPWHRWHRWPSGAVDPRHCTSICWVRRACSCRASSLPDFSSDSISQESTHFWCVRSVGVLQVPPEGRNPKYSFAPG